MTEYDIIPARPAHVVLIANRMRLADKREAWAGYRLTPFQAVQQSFLASREPKVGIADGWPVCMFGCSDHGFLGMVGHPWLFTTELLPPHAKAFLRRNDSYIASLMQRYVLLENWVDARNKAAILWLRWLGFQVEPAAPFGPNRELFRHFWRHA